jgi:outer membrane protein TolC
MAMRTLFLLTVAVVAATVPASAAPMREDLSALIGSHPLIRSSQAQLNSAEKNVNASLGPVLN